MTIKELKELALSTVTGKAPANFSLGEGEIDFDAAFKDALGEFAGSINQFMKNRYDLYDIVIQNVDEVVPKNVIDAIGIFAEVQTVARNQKAIFRRKLGRSRARKFLTQVGVSGLYESFRLDSAQFEVSGHAIGGACSIDFERMLDGAETMSDFMEIVTEALTNSVYVEVQRALTAAINQQGVPAANRAITNGFEPDQMLKLIRTVSAYGQSAVIFAPPEFVADMGPDAIVPVPASGNYGGVYHPQDIDRIHNQGYINIFRGTPIVQLPQSFVDENNEGTYIDPQVAYVLPTGAEKVVKIVFEGPTQINDFKNKDQSMEVHIYKRIGCAIFTYHNWAIYQNTRIPQTREDIYSEYL